MNQPIPSEEILNKIHEFRSQKVMLDFDLAGLYAVPTKRINEQVKRNPNRFPEDFMFQLNENEWENLKSQNATPSWGGRRTLPYAFTEHGVLMLSSVLKSDRAVEVNIHIMRVYTQMRKMLFEHQELWNRIGNLEEQVGNQGESMEMVLAYLQRFIQEETKPRKSIGFKRKDQKE
ncbi:ORF6N domain-containing protein [bacterium SCSIO 12741]|nr:ORF6N domain-containing protein [bacterium SCSIO 12741]